MSEQNGSNGSWTTDVVAGNGTADNPTRYYPLVSIKEFKCLFPGEDKDNDVIRVEQQFLYETVAASQTNQVLGSTGAVGDFIQRLVITVNTAATAAVSIADGGGSAIPIMPNSPGSGIGVYSIELNLQSMVGAWAITTGAGSTVLAVGRFT